MDEMEIICLHKRCNKKARKTSQPKKAPKSFKSDEPKKVPGSPGLIDDPSGDEQKPKKTSKTTKKSGKKLKRSHSLKKHQSHLNLLTQAKKKKRMTKTKNTSFTWAEGRSPKFFASWKDSQNLTIEKKVKKLVFMRGLYDGYELSRVALDDTKYLRGVLKMSGLGKKTKDLIKKHWQRPNSF